MDLSECSLSFWTVSISSIATISFCNKSYSSHRYPFIYMFTIIVQELLGNYVGAVAGVALVSFVLVSDVRAVFVLVMIVLMIDVELLAMMRILDVKLDGVAFVCLLVSIGLVVDYAMHVVREYFFGEEWVGGISF